jgi:GNAT superfamily N-acetyltransferase
MEGMGAHPHGLESAFDRKNPLLQVGRLEARHESAWRQLWQSYLAFYGVELEDAVTANTWRMMVAPKSPTIGLGAECKGELLGFAHIIVHERTWTLGPTAYLEDLYVTEEARGCGIGGSLIRATLAMGRKRNWSSLYWHTRSDNGRARALYDGFAKADEFVRYRVSLP